MTPRPAAGQEPALRPDPELFILHPSGNPLYIANEDDNLVTVIDLEKNKVLAEVPVGVEPEGMGISPDGAIWSTRPKPPTWRISSTRRPMRSVDNVLVDSRPRFAEFSADGSSSGLRPKSAAP